ncbi:MAG: hypothetical protein ACR2QW_09915 [bacterium]
MQLEMNQQDLGNLAALTSEMVHSIDFSEQEKFDQEKITFLHLLDHLDHHYGNSEILFDARAAVSAKPFRKLDLYTVTRKLIRLARNNSVGIAEHHAEHIAPMVPAAIMSTEQPVNALAC